jgi:Gas vesicle synthesis protein GvpO
VAEEEQPEEQPARKPPARSASRTRKPRQADHDARHDADRQSPREAGDAEHRRPTRRTQHSDGHLNAVRAARLGLRQIAELTGKEPAGVASVERSEDGWTVGVEVVEDRRIPSSTDVLALYQADLAGDGELVGYRRIRRYKRGQGDTEYGGESW